METRFICSCGSQLETEMEDVFGVLQFTVQPCQNCIETEATNLSEDVRSKLDELKTALEKFSEKK